MGFGTIENWSRNASILDTDYSLATICRIREKWAEQYTQRNWTKVNHRWATTNTRHDWWILFSKLGPAGAVDLSTLCFLLRNASNEGRLFNIAYVLVATYCSCSHGEARNDHLRDHMDMSTNLSTKSMLWDAIGGFVRRQAWERCQSKDGSTSHIG